MGTIPNEEHGSGISPHNGKGREQLGIVPNVAFKGEVIDPANMSPITASP